MSHTDIKNQSDWIKKSGFKYHAEIVIWAGFGMTRFGFAVQGYRPSSLPYESEQSASTAARRFIRALPRDKMTHPREVCS